MCKHLVKMVVDLDSGVKISEVTVSPRFSPPFIAIDGLHNSEFLAADDATIALPLVRSLSTYVQPFISSFTIPLRAYQVNVHFSLLTLHMHTPSVQIPCQTHTQSLPTVNIGDATDNSASVLASDSTTDTTSSSSPAASTDVCPATSTSVSSTINLLGASTPTTSPDEQQWLNDLRALKRFITIMRKRFSSEPRGVSSSELEMHWKHHQKDFGRAKLYFARVHNNAPLRTHEKGSLIFSSVCV